MPDNLPRGLTRAIFLKASRSRLQRAPVKTSPFRPKRIEVTTPYLTLGMQNDVEEKFNIRKGKMIAITTKGDLDMITIFLSLLIARSSLLETGSKTVKSAVSYPSVFTKKELLEDATREILLSRGVPSRVEIQYHAMRNASDVMAMAENLDDFDFFLAIYFDFHLVNSRDMKEILVTLQDKKSKGMVLLNRFNRLKKTITDSVDSELLVDVTRYLSPGMQFKANGKMMAGKNCGTYTIVTAADQEGLSCKLKYPFTFH